MRRSFRWKGRCVVKKAITAMFVLAIVLGKSFAYDTEALEKGRAAARALNDRLRTKLLSTMEAGGPASGVVVCEYQAQALTNEVQRTLGVRVKRTSLKIRNPRNAPDEYERDLLIRLAEKHRQGMLPVEIMEERREGGQRVFRYAKPLVAASFCITCHGRAEEIPPDVRSELEIRYPDDNATGYREGDLRGIVSVIIPAE